MHSCIDRTRLTDRCLSVRYLFDPITYMMVSTRQLTMRRMMTTMVMLCGVASTACASRGGTPTSAGTVSEPPPVVVPVPVPPPARPAAPTRVTIPRRVQEQRYRVESVARLERDSSGLKEQAELRTTARILFGIERDALRARGTGVVDSFLVRGLENTSRNASAPMQPMTVPFEFSMDSMQVRVAVRPALTNECDAPETGATGLVRDLLVPVPQDVSVGSTWSDSSASFMCRAGVPIVMRVRSRYTVDRIELRDDRVELHITRTMESALEGSSTVAWRARSVRGNGSGTYQIRIDGQTGALLELTGRNTLTLDVRTAQMTQVTELRVSRAGA